MSTSLPEHVRPVRLARRGESVSGVTPVAGMSRLLPSLYSDAGEVAVDLRFHCDQEGRHRITGTVRGVLELVCQRCLGPMRFEIESSVRLEIEAEDAVQSEESDEDYEPLLVAGEYVSLRDVIEDELILALPAHPRHAQGGCRVAACYRPAPDAQSERQRPFDVLAKLKR